MKIGVVQFPGSNCEAETKRSIKQAGMEPKDIFWNSPSDEIVECDGFVIVGGFSYEDRSRSGVIAALQPIMKHIRDQSVLGKPVLGICNGAQILVEAGFFGGNIALTHNRQIKNGKIIGNGFYNDWVNVKSCVESDSTAFTRFLNLNEFIKIPAAHAEGRFVFINNTEKEFIPVFRYSDENGIINEDFPVNPNGSTDSVAAVSNIDGNVLAIMPHPERSYAGLPFFHSMREFINNKKFIFKNFSKEILQEEKAQSLSVYNLKTNQKEFIVEEILTDNTSFTVTETLKNLGIDVVISRKTHWEIEKKEENILEDNSKLLDSELFFNSNKEFLVENFKPKEGELVLLVQQKEDILGEIVKENLSKFFGIKQIGTIKKGVLWTIDFKNKNPQEILEKILKINIIYNSNSQVCYFYSKNMYNNLKNGLSSDIYTEYIRKNIENCLKETDLRLSEKRKGKIRDIYDLSDKLVLISTDRQSAFDRLLAHIPFKGQVLNQTSAWWFNKTKHIVPNHLIDSPDPNAVVVKKCKPFAVEFVVRGYITGSTNTSAWVNYSSGVRNFCGNLLPEGLRKNQKFEKPIITPTTKSDEHDEGISPEEIMSRGLMSQEDWDYVSKKAMELFVFGQYVAKQNGLILVDTKYEFGKTETGEILLIDEIHTPDSSRFWIEKTYEERFFKGEEPEYIDKEFFRLWFKENCDPYNDQILPVAPKELITELSRRYIRLFEMITGEEFIFPEENIDIQNRILKNLERHIKAVPIKNENLNASNKGKVVLISGSTSDSDHAKIITDELVQFGIEFDEYVASAHKEPLKVLEILEKYKNNKRIVYLTIAGRSNALSGFVGANSNFPTIACPPFKDKVDMMVNIQSTLQMPSSTPVLTILDPKNAALAIKRIMNL